MDFGVIQPVTLTKERKEFLEEMMVRVYRSLRSVLTLAFQRDIFPSELKRLRDEHLRYQGTDQDPLLKFRNTAALVAQLRELESEILAAYVRVPYEWCTKYEYTNRDAFPEVGLEDYQSQAEMAIWDAMYTFDGSQQFSTFVYCCVRNYLVNYVRKLSRRREVMSHLGQKTLSLVAREDNDLSGLESMREAVATADLTPIERELIEAHLDGKRGYRSQLEREKRINPDTGRPYTRAWLGQIFKNACEKCQQTLALRAA